MTTALILPQVPELASFDVANLREITTPDVNCVKDVKVVLAGFDSITDDFMVRNKKAWSDKGESWPTEADYKLDGMTLYVEMMLSDTNAVAVCIQKGVDGSEADYTCFGLSYDGAETPKVTQRFTQTLTQETNYVESSVALQSPTFLQLSEWYDYRCGSSSGQTYTGGGVSQCWGMQAGVTVTQSAVVWVPVKAYLFLPVQFAEERYGFRWDAGDLTSVRVIARPSQTSGACIGGNKESKVTLASGLHIATSLAVSLLMSAILF